MAATGVRTDLAPHRRLRVPGWDAAYELVHCAPAHDVHVHTRHHCVGSFFARFIGHGVSSSGPLMYRREPAKFDRAPGAMRTQTALFFMRSDELPCLDRGRTVQTQVQAFIITTRALPLRQVLLGARSELLLCEHRQQHDDDRNVEVRLNLLCAVVEGKLPCFCVHHNPGLARELL